MKLPHSTYYYRSRRSTAEKNGPCTSVSPSSPWSFRAMAIGA